MVANPDHSIMIDANGISGVVAGYDEPIFNTEPAIFSEPLRDFQGRCFIISHRIGCAESVNTKCSDDSSPEFSNEPLIVSGKFKADCLFQSGDLFIRNRLGCSDRMFGKFTS